MRLLAARDPWVELKVLGTRHLTPKGETLSTRSCLLSTRGGSISALRKFHLSSVAEMHPDVTSSGKVADFALRSLSAHSQCQSIQTAQERPR